MSWAVFEWNREHFPGPCECPSPCKIRAAGEGDEAAIVQALRSSFLSDVWWADVAKIVADGLSSQVPGCLADESGGALVVTHGTRIVGVSLLDAGEHAESHLLSGPCVTPEYRGRGMAGALFSQSLAHLFGRGRKTVRGVTRTGSITAKYIYGKFASQQKPHGVPASATPTHPRNLLSPI